MTTRIAVICAMDSEAAHLRQQLVGAAEQPLARWRRTRGTLAGVSVDLIVSGIGMVSASATTSALCLLDPPDLLLNYGCAGAHRLDLGPGDVIIGDRVVHFSAQIVRPDGTRDYMGFDYVADGARVQTGSIPTAPELVALAQRCAAQVRLPAWPGYETMPSVHTGTVASADIWTQHSETILSLHDLHGSLCEEMEAAAIAQVAAIYGIPFLPVKDVSNNELLKATGGATERGWPSLGEQELEVGRRAAMLVEAIIVEVGSGAPV